MMRHQERQKLSLKKTLNTVGVLYRSLYVSRQNSLWLCVVAFLAFFFFLSGPLSMTKGKFNFFRTGNVMFGVSHSMM